MSFFTQRLGDKLDSQGLALHETSDKFLFAEEARLEAACRESRVLNKRPERLE